jgi:hypothetical protein
VHTIVIILVVLGIWVLLNALFVVVMVPPRKPKGHTTPGSSLAPATIDKRAYAPDPEEKASIGLIIVSVAMGAFLVLSHPIIEAVDGIRRLFRKSSPS